MGSGSPFGGNRQDQLVNDLLTRGVALLNQGRVDEAVAELEVAHRLAPALAAKEYARVLLAQGSAQESVGDRAAALGTYETALSVAPDGGLQTEITDIIRDLRERNAAPLASAEPGWWPRRRSGVLVVALVVLLAAGGIGTWQASGLFGDSATPTAEVASLPTTALFSTPLADADAFQTATAAAIATADATGLELARQAQNGVPPVFGPTDDVIYPQQDDIPEPPFLDDFLGRTLADFRAEASFVNPDDPEGDSWDYGFVFRWQDREAQDPGTHYRLFVTNERKWELRFGTNDNSRQIASGRLEGEGPEGFETGAGGANHLRLVAVGPTGYFYVNRKFIAELDLSGLTNPGLLSPATEMLDTDEGVNGPTGVTGFTAWAIGP